MSATLDIITPALSMTTDRHTEAQIEHALCESWRMLAVRETAAKAMIVHRARECGIPTSRLSVLLGVNAQRLSQLDIYGAWVQMHHDAGHALHTLAPERRMRPYLEDARKLRSTMVEVAEEAERMSQEGIMPTADPKTGELMLVVPKHARQREADDYKSVSAAAASVRNVAKRVTKTVDVVGRWTNWAKGASPDDVESFKGTAQWLIRTLQGAVDELADG